MYQESCDHLNDATNIPTLDEKPVCDDCGCLGPNLWICLSNNCYRIGCSEKSNDHSTLHNIHNPSHCIHMNLGTKRIWCYKCKNEVFFNQEQQQQSINNKIYDSDQDMDSTTSSQYKSRIDRDSGHGSYTTLKTINSLNVGMCGDTSGDNSENDEPSASTTTTTTTTAVTTNSDYNNLLNHNDRPMGLVGLQNIGNTCYMNAALQALSNAVPLTRFFLENALIVELLSEGKKPGLSRTYQALMREMWRKNGGYVTPSGILYGIRNVHATFRGFYQHDTQEFLRNFMDQLHEELKQSCPPESLANPTTKSTSISDSDTFCLAMDEQPSSTLSSSYDSSDGEYETCDSGVSERSSLSDDTERPTTTTTQTQTTNNNSRRRISRSSSPGRRLRTRLQSSSMVIDSQPSTSTTNTSNNNNNNNKQKQQKYRSIISDIFDGKLLSSVQCLTCDRISSRIETFQDLSLPIPSRDHLVVLHGRNATTTNSTNNINAAGACTDSVIPVNDGGWLSWILSWLKSWFYGPIITLHDCLSAFFSTDELKGDNMYSCEKCNKLRNGIKFSKVLQLPEILCIHLKRFRHELMFSSKISSFVSFPLNDLDMRPYLHNDCVSKTTTYELFSVICHYGTAGGGHYICYALNNHQWYEFDDQYVTRVTPEKVQSCEAYVLFYRKISQISNGIRLKANQLFRNCTDCVPNEIAYISKQWISRFNTCCEPGGIDNTDFLCQHGSIHPDRATILEQLIIPIPLLVYEYLYEMFGGCPPITTVHICPACLALNNRIQYEMQTFIKLNHDGQINDAQMTHLLSTNWYSQWQRFIQKSTVEPPGPIDNTTLTLNNYQQIQINDCFEIPETLWNFFYNIYGGGPEIRLKTNQSNYNNNNDNNNNSDKEDATEFVIPQLKRNEHHKKDAIDKKIYCSGEPMDIDDNNKYDQNSNTDTTTTTADVVNLSNGYHKTNHLNNNHDSDADDGNNGDVDDNNVKDDDNDGDDDDVTYVQKFNNQRYRRRKRLI